MHALLLALALSAVPTITVTGQVLTPSGAPVTSGSVTCRLTTPGKAFDGVRNQVVATETTATITAGAVSVVLVPNDAISPTGSRYTCTFTVTIPNGRRVQWAQQWQTTSTPATQAIGDVPVPTYALGAAMPAASPVFSPASGTVAQLSMSANTPSSWIYYTVDGSTPTTSSAVYAGPFVPPNTGSSVTVKATAAPLLGWSLSGVTSATYTDPRVTYGLASSPGCYSTGATIGTNGGTGTFTRATTSVGTIDGGETTCASGQWRLVDGGGYLSEKLATQYLLNNCTAPATQTTGTVPTGWHTGWVEGTGSVAFTAGTATSAGLPCTASGGTVCSFNVTGAGTIVATVTGSVTREFLQTGEGKTSPICAAGTTQARNADLLTVTNPLALADDWCAGVTVKPAYGRDWFASTTSFLGLGSNAAANSARVFSSTSQYIQADVYDGTGAAVSAQLFPFQTAPTPPRPRFNGLPDLSADGSEHRLVFCQRANGKVALHIDGKVMPVTYSATAGTGKLASMPGTIGIGSTVSAANNLNANGVVSNVQVAATTSPVIIGGSPTWLGKGVTCVGDSITSGNVAGVTKAWPTGLQEILGSEWITINHGTSGWTANQILATWNASDYLRRLRYVAVLAGTNSLATQTSAQIMADLTEMYVDALAEGITPILITILPRTGTAQQLTTLAEVNVLLRAYAAQHPEVLLVDAYPSFDNGSGQLRPEYDSGDGLHPNQVGTDLIAQLVAAVVLAAQ